MSFLSYRTRIPRHFDSHANVRSTTHRRGLWPCDRSQPFFSSPIRRMCGVYPAAVAALPPLGCRTPYPGACAAAHPLSVRAARPRYSRSSLPGASVPGRSPRRSPPPAVHRRHRSPGSFWCPFFLGRWDSCPSFPPEAGLAQHRVGRLPLPLHPAEFVTLGDQDRPDSLEDPCCSPALEPVVDSALGSVPLGQLVPLAAAAHPEDDRIQHFPPIGDLPLSRFLGPEFQEDRLEIRRHNSSEISQIVPSGLRRGLRRTMAQSPVVMPGSGHCLLQAPSCKRCSAGSRIVTKVFRPV